LRKTLRKSSLDSRQGQFYERAHTGPHTGLSCLDSSCIMLHVWSRPLDHSSRMSCIEEASKHWRDQRTESRERRARRKWQVTMERAGGCICDGRLLGIRTSCRTVYPEKSRLTLDDEIGRGRRQADRQKVLYTYLWPLCQHVCTNFKRREGQQRVGLRALCRSL
jgi:hypothetical protein